MPRRKNRVPARSTLRLDINVKLKLWLLILHVFIEITVPKKLRKIENLSCR